MKNAYETLLNNRDLLQMYDAGYLGQSQQSLDLAQSAYAAGKASLLDFLDAQRSYRSTQLAYRQALASYMTAIEQLKEAVGTRNLPRTASDISGDSYSYAEHWPSYSC